MNHPVLTYFENLLHINTLDLISDLEYDFSKWSKRSHVPLGVHLNMQGGYEAIICRLQGIEKQRINL